METNKIKAILSAVKYGSLSKAAEELLYTPSALSHMADSLEKELEVKLLTRTHFGVELTNEGNILYEKLCAVIKSEEELYSALKALKKGKNCELKIGSYSSISTKLLPEIITDFKKKNPDIRVSIVVEDNLKKLLEQGDVDVVFGDDTVLGGTDSVIIMNDPFVAVTPENLFQRRKSVRIEELYSYPYISTNEDLLLAHFDESKFSDVIKIESADLGAVLSMVARGMGIAVLPSLAADEKKRGFKTLKLSPDISRKIGFAHNKGSYAVEKFVEYLKEKYKGKE